MKSGYLIVLIEGYKLAFGGS